MTDKTSLLLFSFTIWGMISWMVLAGAVDNYKLQKEFQEKIKRGECPFMDQKGNCWTARQYQNYLEKQSEIKFEIK